MANFTIHKAPNSFDYTTSGTPNGVYFEVAGAAASPAENWLFLRVTTNITSPISLKKLAIESLPGNNIGSNEVSGIYFSDLTTGWPSGAVGQIVMRTQGSYLGASGLGRSVILDNTFALSYNGTVGAYVLSATGTATGITSFAVQTNDSNSILQVASTEDGSTGISYSTSATVNGTNDTLDIRFTPITSRHSILGARDTAASAAAPSYRQIQAGSVKATVSTAEEGDIYFEGYVQTEGATVDSWLKIIATDVNANNTGSYGKAYFLDASLFTVGTIAPTGGAIADRITLNLAAMSHSIVAEGATDAFGATYSLYTGRTLNISTNTSVTDIFNTTMTAANTNTATLNFNAVDAAADKIVFWDESADKLTYLAATQGLSISTTNLVALPFGIDGVGSGYNWTAATTAAHTITPGNAVGTRMMTFVEGSNVSFEFDDTLKALKINAAAGANNGSLTLQTVNPGTGIGVSVVTGTGFTADDASNETYQIGVGPSISGLATIMTGATTGFLKKTGVDTYSLDSATYLTSWGFTIAADAGTADAIANAGILTFAGTDPINTTVSDNQIAISLNYNSTDFEVNAGVLQLKDKYTSDWKQSCRVATAGGETINVAGGEVTSINGTAIDGVTCVIGDRILVKNAGATTGVASTTNTTQPANGIYVVTNATTNLTLDRAEDANITGEVTTGLTTTVSEGTKNADIVFQLITNDTITVNTTPIAFTAVSKVAFFGAGQGLTIDASTNNITFCRPGTSTVINQSTTEVWGGIRYQTDSIEVAIDANFFAFSSDLLSMASASAWTIFGRTATTSGTPGYSAFTEDSILARVGTTDPLSFVQLNTSLQFLGHDATSLGAKTFNSNNFEWSGSTLQAKWTTNAW